MTLVPARLINNSQTNGTDVETFERLIITFPSINIPGTDCREIGFGLRTRLTTDNRCTLETP
jgi:hypothetical protein